MGELLSGAEGQFRGQGMGTPGTGPAGCERGPVPGVPPSVEDALDGDLDAYLDRELFVRPSTDSAAQASESESTNAATGSMRALLDLADEESEWLETLPAPTPRVAELPEPEAPAVEIPEWMRMSPGAKVTTPFAAMLSPADPTTVPAHGEAESAGTDAAGLPTTPWSTPTSAQMASAPAYPGSLLPGIAPPPPGVTLPAWAPQHAAPMAQYPQQWGMPLPAHADPKRIAGMKPGAFVGAAAVGALAAGMLLVAGLHFQEHRSGTPVATVGGQSMGQGTLTGASPFGAAQAGNTGSLPAGMNGAAQAGATTVLPSGLVGATQAAGLTGQPDMPLTSVVAGAAQPGVPGVPGTMALSQNGITSTVSGAQTGPVGTQSVETPGTSEPSGVQQAAASVAGTVLSTAQGDVRSVANGLRAGPSSPAPLNGSAVGGTTLTSGQPGTVALQMPSARKSPAKTVVAARPAANTQDEAEAAPSELTFKESESSSADEESAPAEAADAEEEQQSELDEDFARELGFTEEAEAKAAAPKAPERTVYIPPAPDAKEQLTPDDVKAVVVANQPAITACIRQHAQGTPVEKGGRFLVRWSVLPSGDTSGVSMDTDTLKATELAHCIEDVVRRWKFPAHQVRMQEPIRFPFVF
ncbi:AgmX/PglI C-terminal domain-containing protein [Pyxidicoccus caerfyrddinensis]|uniref:AgmX/PglI C-terminal domain-containing protein n=1 Tax=Pyxidicoccus caerfyrddinensis TaxID=2709663 RepID=UPI0013DC8FD4|nr:AgmX/PglI C-terminal domain-containing protein [Pyxidicoccus caerfyrddinensis]